MCLCGLSYAKEDSYLCEASESKVKASHVE